MIRIKLDKARAATKPLKAREMRDESAPCVSFPHRVEVADLLRMKFNLGKLSNLSVLSSVLDCEFENCTFYEFSDAFADAVLHRVVFNTCYLTTKMFEATAFLDVIVDGGFIDGELVVCSTRSACNDRVATGVRTSKGKYIFTEVGLLRSLSEIKKIDERDVRVAATMVWNALKTEE